LELVNFGVVNVKHCIVTIPSISPSFAPRKFKPIEVIYNEIEGGTETSLDFYIYVFVASALSSLGIVFSNYILIISAMIICPISGGIIGASFGMYLYDMELFVKGIGTILKGMSIGFFVGLVMGLIFGIFGNAFDWPSGPIKDGGYPITLIASSITSIVSGVGTVMSISDREVNPLIGVAVAITLMLPVCSCAICIVFASLGPYIGNNQGIDIVVFLWLAFWNFIYFAVNVFCVLVGAVFAIKLQGLIPRHTQKYWSKIINSNIHDVKKKARDLKEEMKDEYNHKKKFSIANPAFRNYFYNANLRFA